jgi:hypothetical protein
MFRDRALGEESISLRTLEAIIRNNLEIDYVERISQADDYYSQGRSLRISGVRGEKWLKLEWWNLTVKRWH